MPVEHVETSTSNEASEEQPAMIEDSADMEIATDPASGQQLNQDLSIGNTEDLANQPTQPSPPTQPQMQHTVTQPSSQEELITTMQQQDLRIKMLEDRINLIEQYNDKNKAVQQPPLCPPGPWAQKLMPNPSGPPQQQQENNLTKKKMLFTPAPIMDMNGSICPDQNPAERQDHQPLDWVKVTLPKRRWETRPSLSSSMDQHVASELDKHMESKYGGENCPKTRAQKQMTDETRVKAIQTMLDRAGFKLGMGPFTEDHRTRVEKFLAQKGLFRNSDTPDMRKQKTIKSLIKSWAIKNLKMTEKDWDTIAITDITMNVNTDIVFVTFGTKEDVTKFTSRARNLPTNQGEDTPKLVMFVDRRASKRYKAVMNIAKSIRENSKAAVQTCVRTGKSDFLLRTRIKGSDTPWTEIPPLKISQEIPHFEIGSYKDLVNPQNNVEFEIIQDHPAEDMEDLESMAQDLSRQNSQEDKAANKRDRTGDDSVQPTKRKSYKTRANHNLSPSDQDESSGDSDDGRTGKVMNSTPIFNLPSSGKMTPQAIDQYKVMEHKNQDDNIINELFQDMSTKLTQDE